MKKRIILGVTGGIAAYKSAMLASLLVKNGFDVQVIMTKNAQQFISPITFEALTKNRCITDTFDRMHSFEIEHVSLADSACLAVIAPASANVIGKMANGIADDMLTTTILACKCKKLVAPAMNTNMYENAIVQENIKKLSDFGFEIVGPQSGRLACGVTGMGKMSEPDEIFSRIISAMTKKDLSGKRVLVTAGATAEAIDPVRYITNHSTGKMGCAVAEAAAMRGADVTLVHGLVTAEIPIGVTAVSVRSAGEMYDAVMKIKDEFDIIIKAAAVADYTPAEVADGKIKKNDSTLSLELVKTKDILKALGESKKNGQILCGFSMETENVLENSKKKLVSKNLDMICANCLKTEGAGFGTDTNVLSLITANGTEELAKMSKRDAADIIIDKLMTL